MDNERKYLSSWRPEEKTVVYISLKFVCPDEALGLGLTTDSDKQCTLQICI